MADKKPPPIEEPPKDEEDAAESEEEEVEDEQMGEEEEYDEEVPRQTGPVSPPHAPETHTPGKPKTLKSEVGAKMAIVM